MYKQHFTLLLFAVAARGRVSSTVSMFNPVVPNSGLRPDKTHLGGCEMLNVRGKRENRRF